MNIGNSFPLKLSALAAFCIPALALWLPSGYSYGAALFLLGALLFAPQWLQARPDRKTQLLALFFLLMAVAWYQLSALESGAGRWDRPVKFLLGIACLLYAVQFPPPRRAFFWGLAVGCVGAGLKGLWQVYHLDFERATGGTNAIQWGNIALLMALLLALQAGIFWRDLRWVERGLVVGAVVLGCEASVLSAARGGWVALLGMLPVAGFFLWRYRRDLALKMAAGMAVFLAVIVLSNSGMLSARWTAMDHEVHQYFEKSEKNTSMGVRLEQYRLALDLIRERPLLGWGMQGYREEMSRRVQAGSYSQAIHEYNFIHNELLDLWVKLGIFGFLLQISLYSLIVCIFWPTAQRMAQFNPESKEWKEAFALRLSGVAIPVMYAGFGLSQHFFVHNSGIIFFVFSTIILWSMVCRINEMQ
ncbi:MAG: O-antigen ligase family protein [Simplicispira sp.]|nr:O-antigen ligase family protein [Simplicispira sp.]